MSGYHKCEAKTKWWLMMTYLRSHNRDPSSLIKLTLYDALGYADSVTSTCVWGWCLAFLFVRVSKKFKGTICPWIQRHRKQHLNFLSFLRDLCTFITQCSNWKLRNSTKFQTRKLVRVLPLNVPFGLLNQTSKSKTIQTMRKMKNFSKQSRKQIKFFAKGVVIAL